MLSSRAKIIFVILLLIANWLVRTNITSADVFAERRVVNNILVATTLSFSELHTARNSRISTLFSVSGIQPGGFEVKAIRIRNDGKMNLKYTARVQKIGGDTTFCNTLILESTRNKQPIYNGPLLSFDGTSPLKNNEKDDWVFFVDLEQNSASLQNKMCEFNFIFSSYKNDPQEQRMGFFAEGAVANTIESGNW